MSKDLILFETLRTIEGGRQYQFFREHEKRLLKSAEEIGIIDARNRIDQLFSQLKALLPFSVDKRIKISLGNDQSLFELHDLDRQEIDRWQRGIAVRDVVFERLNPSFKYVTAVYKEFMSHEADMWQETLFVDDQGFVREGNIANVFFVFDSVWVTPPKEVVLPGIMRQKCIKKALSKGVIVEERMITKEEALKADHIFVTNSVKGIVPVQRWGDVLFEMTEFFH